MCLYIPFYIIDLLSFNYSTTRYNFVNLKETRKISHLEELVGGHLPPSSSQRLTSTCMLWYPMSKNIFPLHLELHGCVILHSAVGVGQYNTSMQFKVPQENILVHFCILTTITWNICIINPHTVCHSFQVSKNLMEKKCK